MYATPVLSLLDASASQALCCHISSRQFTVQTPLCPFPTCGDSPIVTTSGILPCTVTVAGITVSGN